MSTEKLDIARMLFESGVKYLPCPCVSLSEQFVLGGEHDHVTLAQPRLCFIKHELQAKVCVQSHVYGLISQLLADLLGVDSKGKIGATHKHNSGRRFVLQQTLLID